MDTKFSVAVHALILISESPTPINSEQMAESVGTNASYIRKILALLKKAEIVDGHKEVSGYSLSVAPEQLTLLQVYQAVTEESFSVPQAAQKKSPTSSANSGAKAP